MNQTKFLLHDWETYSEHNIRKCGAYEYSMHPSTEILCVAFRYGTIQELANKPTLLWIPGSDGHTGEPAFSVFLSAVRNPLTHFVAHNAFFEQMILRNVFARRHMPSKPELQRIPSSRFTCTAALARSVGVPGNLEGAGLAFGLRHQKDKEGHRIMLKLCKPRKATKNNSEIRHTPTNAPEDFKKLYAYCKKDVDAETELFLKLPAMTPKEREFWEMDQALNLRGFAVDRQLVQGALSLIERETSRLDSRVFELTGGRVKSARQRDAVLKYLRGRGADLPNLRAGTVKETLKKGGLPSAFARELLEIRESISRSSTAKYKAFEIRSRTDGRARDNLIFFGAHTGRDTGTGLQPQNLFKTILKQEDVETGLELMRRKDFNTIEALYPRPMDLYASALRSCIVAGPGSTLEVGDYATVEVRGLFWLCGEIDGLNALARGEPIYSDMAGLIYDKPGSEIEAGHKSGDKDCYLMRQLGKQTVLGGGFGIGLGGDKFQLTCKQYGLDISLELAQKAVRAYRDRYPRVCAFWTNIEKAAVLALQNPGKCYKVGVLVWKKEGDFLKVRLPIGRWLHYFKPELRRIPTLYGDKLTLTYIGTKNGKLVREKTWGGKLTENVVQAIARDLLKESQLALEKSGTRLPILAVHDEHVCERKLDACKLEVFVKTMSGVPAWAKGLPVKVEGWENFRYRK